MSSRGLGDIAAPAAGMGCGAPIYLMGTVAPTYDREEQKLGDHSLRAKDSKRTRPGSYLILHRCWQQCGVGVPAVWEGAVGSSRTGCRRSS